MLYGRTGKPGMLQSMGLQRVGHNWVNEKHRVGSVGTRKAKSIPHLSPSFRWLLAVFSALWFVDAPHPSLLLSVHCVLSVCVSVSFSTQLLRRTLVILMWGQLYSSMGFPGHLVVKNPPANAGDMASKKCWLASVFLPGKPHGQRTLVGYNPWGCKESDMT